jgi:hypothetical protein
MTDEIENEQEDQATGERKKGSGRADGAGAAGIGKAQVSVAFFDTMKRFGVSMENITRILREWKQLSIEELKSKITDFGQYTARASAHLLVQFSSTLGFALVTDFLQELSGREPVLAYAPAAALVSPR